MATIKDNEISDLLILDDNSANNEKIILEESIIEEEIKPSATELITFDEEPLLDVRDNEGLNSLVGSDVVNLDSDTSTVDMKIDEDISSTDLLGITPSIDITDNTPSEKDSNNIDDLSINIESETGTMEDNDIFNLMPDEESSDDVVIEELNNDIEDTSLNVSLDIDTAGNSSYEGTMIDILDDAMNKLGSRVDVISNEIISEEGHESDLKSKIIDLEAEVKVANDKISELKSEKTLISKNSKSLEKMKGADPISEVKTNTSK